MRRIVVGFMAAAALLGAAGQVEAQGLTVTPSLGAYIPASDFKGLRDEAENQRLEKEGTLALGLSVEMGWLRGTLAYASGAKITDEGVDGEDQLGEGTLLIGAADIVLRPLPRLVIVQPYVLGGVGFRNESYDTDEATDLFPEDDRSMGLHIGAGLDVMLGGLGLMAEVTDFISKDLQDDWGRHDAFAMVGLKLRL